MSPASLTERFCCLTDSRGALCVAQKDLLHRDFDIRRVFWIFDVPEGAIRGEHANRTCTELLVAVSGSVKVVLSDGNTQCEFLLDQPDKGLYIPPMVWCRLQDFAPGSVCVCMADQDYNEALYINRFEDFVQATRHAQPSL